MFKRPNTLTGRYIIKNALNADQILQADDLPSTWVGTPEWGTKTSGVYVRGMTGRERDSYEGKVAGLESGQTGKMNYVNMRASLVALCVCDESGSRLFTEEQVESLGAKSGAVLDRLFDICRSLSGMGEDAIKNSAKN